MRFHLLNSPDNKGDYLFKGRPIIFETCYKYFTKEAIDDVVEQIWKYTRTGGRSSLIMFENEKGERLYAYDNLSEIQIHQMRTDKAISEFNIQEKNFFLIIPSCDLL